MSDSILPYFFASILLIIGYFAIKYPDRAAGTRARPDLKGPKGLPIIGNLITTLRKIETFNDYLLELTKKYGDIYTLTLPGPRRMIMINTPELLEYILKDNYLNYPKGPYYSQLISDLFGHGIFNVDGTINSNNILVYAKTNRQSWKFQRRIISHVFQGRNFRTIICREFEEHSKIMLRILSKAAETGESIDFTDLFFRFTMDTFVKICFNENLGTLTDLENTPLFSTAFDYTLAVIEKRVLNSLWPILEKFNEQGRKNREYCKVLDDFAFNIIQHRRREPLKNDIPTDILHLFMDARHDNGEELNDKELRDIILNLIIAGRDSTANTLSWMMYRIMTNPSVEQNLLKEINSLITPTNPFPDYDSINNLPYSLATLNETLRLHPAVPRNFKTVVEDDTLPGGVPVYSGDMIFWVPYSMGRDERVWGKDVDEFKPTRFLKSGKFVRQSPYKLIAFNAGPRVCLGQEFATVQALTLLSVMLKDFHFELLTSEKLIKYRPSITLQMKHPLMVKVTRRE